MYYNTGYTRDTTTMDYDNLTDEEVIEYAIDALASDSDLPGDIRARLKEMRVLHLFTREE